jgi:hypothetical protein
MDSEKINSWLQWVLITSIPLRRLDDSNLPVGIASGCLVDYCGKRFLLSVQHAVKPTSSSWAVEVRYDRVKGTELYRPNHFNYMGEMKLGSASVRHIDFCYTEVPVDFLSHYQHIVPSGDILDERIRHVFATELNDTPSTESVYAFSGQVLPDRIENTALCTTMSVYPGLRYLNQEGEYYVFKLPVNHPGHEHFQGCSGAPIVDHNQNVVALVCDGDETNNTIRGVSLSRYKIAFDILCENLNIG